jgi:hypothetical protein
LLSAIMTIANPYPCFSGTLRCPRRLSDMRFPCDRWWAMSCRSPQDEARPWAIEARTRSRGRRSVTVVTVLRRRSAGGSRYEAAYLRRPPSSVLLPRFLLKERPPSAK